MMGLRAPFRSALPPHTPAVVGVRYVGYLAEGTGYGQAAREHLVALAATGVPTSARSILLGAGAPFDVSPDPRVFPEVARLADCAQPYDTVVAHTPPEVFPAVREAGRRNIGVAAWETEVIPDAWRDPIRAMDELWVPSEFCARAFRQATASPVAVIPHPISVPEPRERFFPGIPDDIFLFASVFEWSDRKNPEGLVRAFRKAFAGRGDVGLVLKVGLRFGGDPETLLASLRRLVSPRPWRSPPIYVLAQTTTSPAVLAQLYARADAYVSLHRAEGFGLCMAEAMAAGKPVVATGYSGNLEFMDERSAFLVDYEMARIEQRLSFLRFFDRRMWWAEPNVDHAVAQLRRCADDSSARGTIAARGRSMVIERLDPRRVGALMLGRLLGEPFALSA
jgi:glycosyltransferase involved in cell wall biosynthesis